MTYEISKSFPGAHLKPDEGVRSTSYNIGLGITSRCNAHCKHCYSHSLGRKQDLPFERIKHLVGSVNIKSVNLGTGEPGLHPDFTGIIDYLFMHVPEVSITSNGSTLAQMCDDRLTKFNDVDISLDFPDNRRHDSFRGLQIFDVAISQIKRCQALGVKCSIATAVTRANLKHLLELLQLARQWNTTLRLNLYKQTGPQWLLPRYQEFWEVFIPFFKTARIVSCSEPIFKVVLGLFSDQLKGSPCGYNSIRVRPDGKINRCVYLPGNNSIYVEQEGNNEVDIHSVIKRLEHPGRIPEECKNCPHVDVCQGGCESRRLLGTGLEKPEMYCPYLHGDNLHLEPIMEETADPHDYVHSYYLCTTIVM